MGGKVERLRGELPLHAQIHDAVGVQQDGTQHAPFRFLAVRRHALHARSRGRNRGIAVHGLFLHHPDLDQRLDLGVDLDLDFVHAEFLDRVLDHDGMLLTLKLCASSTRTMSVEVTDPKSFSPSPP